MWGSRKSHCEQNILFGWVSWCRFRLHHNEKKDYCDLNCGAHFSWQGQNMELSASTQPEGVGEGDFGGVLGQDVVRHQPASKLTCLRRLFFFFLQASFVLIGVALQGLTAKPAAWEPSGRKMSSLFIVLMHVMENEFWSLKVVTPALLYFIILIATLHELTWFAQSGCSYCCSGLML